MKYCTKVIAGSYAHAREQSAAWFRRFKWNKPWSMQCQKSLHKPGYFYFSSVSLSGTTERSRFKGRGRGKPDIERGKPKIDLD